MPIRLPEPICPSGVPSVASSIISINLLAPLFKLSSGLPAMLPDLSRIRTISVGEVVISGKLKAPALPAGSLRSQSGWR